jgi:putative methionine-R-sulfoxide reductase with GAF domain
MNSSGSLAANAAGEHKKILVERRSRPRHKTHTPAYVSFNDGENGAILDLSEVLDVSETGISIQASPHLEPNQQVHLILDLSETESHVHTAGTVVWSDPSGRAGIRFSGLTDKPLRELREWLLINNLVACANQASISQEVTVPAPETAAAPNYSEPLVSSPTAAPDFTNLLTALAAVEREVESFGPNLDAALHLIAERAQALTRSTGAAIALFPADANLAASSLQDQVMVCRASSGPDAPPVGARLQVGSGFSGECVRTGRLLHCDDSETDPVVNRESCRQLGIRSMLAAPVRLGENVIGLLEVFAPVPYAFTESDTRVLQRLSEIVLAAVNRANLSRSPRPGTDRPETARSETARVVALPAAGTMKPVVSVAPPELESVPSPEEDRPSGYPVPRTHVYLLITVAAIVALALGYLLAPWIDSKWNKSAARDRQPSAPSPAAATPSVPKARTEASVVEQLRTLAEHGDANAQFAIGARYATGEDVAQNFAEAVTWFSKAAEQGHVVAQATLAAYYWAGRGVPQDLNKAYFWSILARAGGDEGSKFRAAALSSRMTRAQVLAAQQAANDWLKQHQVASNSQPAN